MFDLTGKVAIVTGGAGGLGKPLALALAKQGADVVVTSRTLAKLEPVAKEIQGMGRRSIAIASDVTDPVSLAAMVERVVKEFSRIDILLNAHGVNARFSALEFDPKEFEKVIMFNVVGTFLSCQAVGRVMVQQKKGKIINLSSVRGKNAPRVGGSAYAASKGGVDALTRTLAVEWAEHNIQVNAIAPALLITDMTRDFLSVPATYKAMTAEIPQNRLGETKDILGATILLASSEADFMTGQIIYIDGGLSVR